MALKSSFVPNLVQGVSQQSPRQRRDAQCEEQFDCFNSPVDGCVARHGFDLVKILNTADWRGAFTYEIIRSDTEQYIALIKGGAIKVYDLLDGTECTVTIPGGHGQATYLTSTGAARDSFVATTVGDTTFLANKEIKPALKTGSEAPSRPNEALVFFRSGNYSSTYQFALIYGGRIRVLSYTTPDNSLARNAPYITTNQLAATFYRMMTKRVPPQPLRAAVGAAVGSAIYGVGAAGRGDPATGKFGKYSGNANLLDLGFFVQLNGNVIRIYRNDANDFDIDVADPVGGNALVGIKDTTQSFSNLPRTGAPNGYVVKIRGTSRVADDDYWVKFVANSADSGPGEWIETSKPGVKQSLDQTTMPYKLVNTGYRAFTLDYASWGSRAAGDGSVTVKDPSLIGRYIRDIFYDNDRLAILLEGSCVWSKARNPYVFFATSAQTVLATDPVDIQVNNSRFIALLRRAVQAGGALLLWAQRVQSIITGGEEGFRQETVDAKALTAFEFVEAAAPLPVGDSLFFATQVGDYAAIRDVLIQNGRVGGDTDVTEHVAKYVPKGVRLFTGSDTNKTLFVLTDDEASKLYVYNWRIAGRDRVQSSWQTWRLPSTSEIIWAGTVSSILYAIVHREGGTFLLSLPLSLGAFDAQGRYRTRMDLRVDETDCTVVYDSGTNRTTITLPYRANEAEADPTKFIVVTRDYDATADLPRGYPFSIVSVNSNKTVVVTGDASTADLYCGFAVSSERLESEFYERTEEGHHPFERVQVEYITIHHANTGYYKVNVTFDNGRTETKALSDQFTGTILGDVDAALDQVALSNGSKRVRIGNLNHETKIRLVNDSFMPSAWQSLLYEYKTTERSFPAK